MSDVGKNQITLLLSDWSRGDTTALERLMPLVYEELRRRAARYMRNQPSGHTFQTTALIHEAYLKIAGTEPRNWENRAHFFAVASQSMRHILVDYARAKQSQKRGAWQERVTFSESAPVFIERSEKMVALDDALKTLAVLDERKAAVVEMKFFGGLTNEEIAEVLKISDKTVMRDWHFARTWLLRELSGSE